MVAALAAEREAARRVKALLRVDLRPARDFDTLGVRDWRSSAVAIVFALWAEWVDALSRDELARHFEPVGEGVVVMPLRLLASLSVLAFMTMGCAGARKDLEPCTQPSVSSLTERPVVGALGVPLGTGVEIRASVVAGRELRDKWHNGSYLLRVTEVNGRPLAPSPVLDFWIRWRPPSANLDSDLYNLQRLVDEGTVPGIPRVTPGEKHKLEKDYMGKQMRLLVYETGEYSGFPRNLPHDVPVPQDRGFGFYTSLVVFDERP